MNKKKLQIILIDDHKRVHQAISEMLDFYDDIELIAQGSNGKEAIDLCNRYSPDLILMDVVMPIMDGIEATKQILTKHPDTKILALSSFEDPNAVREMLEKGAIGYVLKNASITELYHIIRTASDGQNILSPQIMKTLIDAPPDQVDYDLTPRELEVLTLLATGVTNNQVGNELNISTSTVKFHLNNVVSKLGVATRTEALVVAAKNNLI